MVHRYIQNVMVVNYVRRSRSPVLKNFEFKGMDRHSEMVLEIFS